MQRLGDLLHQEPDAAQREVLNHVLDVALAWRRGELGLDAVNGLCSGYERWQAMRFADQTSEGYAALRALVDQCVLSSRGILRTNHGIVLGAELHHDGVKQTTNWAGKRVFVWPLYWMDGEPYYPPVHLPPGEERREIERVMNLTYEAYWKAKKAKEGRRSYGE